MPKLANTKHEAFAYYIAQGEPKTKAYRLAGYTGTSRASPIKLWRHKGQTSANIQRRAFEILESKLKASDLTKDDILNQILETRNLAKASGQHSASLKASEMLGKELFRMFAERKENLNINLQAQNISNLDQYLRDKYGDRAEGLIAWLKRDRANKEFNGEYSTSSEEADSGVDARTQAQAETLRLVYSSDQLDDE